MRLMNSSDFCPVKTHNDTKLKTQKNENKKLYKIYVCLSGFIDGYGQHTSPV